MSRDSQWQAFVDRLAQAEPGQHSYNEYAYGDDNNAIRRANLLRYLGRMAELHPPTLLVMEAPGYRGCRLTGVPVTSRKILLEGVPGLDIFGADRGYENTTDAGFERIYGEQSATIVWGTLGEIGRPVFIWNAFPFHPHQPGNPLSNRRPRKPETLLGAAFLRDVIEKYSFERIIAGGNVAHETLTALGIDIQKVRHPAQGGKNDFVAGLKAILPKG